MKTTHKSEKSWMKNHPMEGDDIITSFYDLLCKRNHKTMKPCRNVFVPDTVVYEHNFPRGWYTSDVKAKEVMRRQGKDLDAATIEYGFSRDVAENFPVVATYLSIHEENIGNGVTETTTRVEVLNKEDIGAFVARKNKSNGILQRFIYPKGHHNSVIKVVWSPRIAMIQRRKNKYPIKDRKRAEKDPFAITVTYEGPEYLSEEGNVSLHVAFEVKSVCSEIIKHFFHTEHKYITRMVLYFKSDVKDRLWLLWCGSLRVAERNTRSHMPMNLAPRFGEPLREGILSEQEMLRNVDMAYFVITKDGPFYETYIRGNGRDKSSSIDRCSTRMAERVHSAMQDTTKSDSHHVGARSKEEEVPNELHELLGALKDLEETVQDAFKDIFYNAYSHFLSTPGSSFDVVVPPNVVEIVTAASILDLMKFLKLSEKECLPGVPVPALQSKPHYALAAAEKESQSGMSSEPPMVFVIPAKFSMPLTVMSRKAEEWIRELFATRSREVKNDYFGDTPEIEVLPSARRVASSTENVSSMGDCTPVRDHP
uniref:Uncharacterized protein TCIL3000_8_8020 n=1 Tax=Trypanosoma congolense (strain IL3000) TaxID=1068625 RepID=G0UT59_TRYCI|nr:unnamed protein product [Trypanosoma congolense IL3000]